MVAYSNGIVLGQMNVAGPLLDGGDGWGVLGAVTVLDKAAVALFVYPAGGVSALANYARLTGSDEIGAFRLRRLVTNLLDGILRVMGGRAGTSASAAAAPPGLSPGWRRGRTLTRAVGNARAGTLAAKRGCLQRQRH